MDSQLGSRPVSIMASLAAAGLGLAITMYTTIRVQHKVQPTAPFHAFNVITGAGLQTIAPTVFDDDAHTNRTIWPTVNTSQLHAGLERLEVEACIPPHSHSTEEVVLVFSGTARIYDENGLFREARPGAMVHMEAHSPHSICNVGNQPLLVAWVFPSLSASDKHQFKPRYSLS